MYGEDLGNNRDLPKVVEETGDGELTIYFESEETKQAYLDMPSGDPARDLKKSLANTNIDKG